MARSDTSRAGGRQLVRPGDQIQFVGRSATGYTGTDRRMRRWQITPCRAGWRLEFRDPGDTEATYAGTHPSRAAAEREANS
jgi:hypothetical protein